MNFVNLRLHSRPYDYPDDRGLLQDTWDSISGKP